MSIVILLTFHMYVGAKFHGYPSKKNFTPGVRILQVRVDSRELNKLIQTEIAKFEEMMRNYPLGRGQVATLLSQYCSLLFLALDYLVIPHQ